jgi:hypothetical protein
MARTRSTKSLSQRIDREYFKRLYTIPKWRRILSLAFTAIGLMWVLGWSEPAFNAGPLSKGHHILEGNCATCHTGSALWGKKVEDQACVTCHDGPAHKEQQTFTPGCLTCHVEHKGSVELASTILDASCTQCHGNLQTKNGKMTVAVSVADFASHPDFEALKSADPGTIKFGHQVHMKADLRGPNGPTQLKCSTCHQAGRDGQMKIANFKNDCESCHRLEFNRRVDKVLPHDKPEIALAFARQALTEYIAKHPGDVNVVDPAIDPRIMTARLGPAGSAAEWIRRGMEDTETLMWRKTCVECHTVSEKHEVAKAQTPVTWLKGAKFDHNPHGVVACTECHGNALQSKATSDVLLPNVVTCQQCHRTSNPSASANCTECHVYHDWSKAKPIDTQRKILELLNR